VIVKKADRYVVMDTETKEVFSEHPFDDNRKSIEAAEKAARESNQVWKSTKVDQDESSSEETNA